jgi:hypothetical protein
MRNIPCTITYSEITSSIESRGFPVTFVWRFVQGVEATHNRPSRLGRVYLDFQKEQDLAKAFVASMNGCSVGKYNGMYKEIWNLCTTCFLITAILF